MDLDFRSLKDFSLTAKGNHTEISIITVSLGFRSLNGSLVCFIFTFHLFLIPHPFYPLTSCLTSHLHPGQYPHSFAVFSLVTLEDVNSPGLYCWLLQIRRFVLRVGPVVFCQLYLVACYYLEGLKQDLLLLLHVTPDPAFKANRHCI